MKRLSLLLIIAVISSVAGLTVRANYHTVTVTVKEGESMSFRLADELTVRFNDLEMTISSPNFDNTVIIPKENISEFIHSTAGINDVTADASAPEFADGMLSFTNLPEGSIINVFNTAGQLIKSETASGCYQLPLSTLAAGIYVVTVNKSTFKIAVK